MFGLDVTDSLLSLLLLLTGRFTAKKDCPDLDLSGVGWRWSAAVPRLEAASHAALDLLDEGSRRAFPNFQSIVLGKTARAV